MDIIKDSNGNILKTGDSVHPVKDLKVKGTSTIIKRDTVIKNIRLTESNDEIECRVGNVKNIILKTYFLKKI